jgi:histidinol dehydrogenase
VIRRLDSRSADFEAQLAALQVPMEDGDGAVSATVAAIIADVVARGDAALIDYTRRFDAIDVDDVEALRIGPAELAASLAALPSAEREALGVAAERIASSTAASANRTGSSRTRTAIRSGSASRRCRGSVSTCPAARRATRRRC